MKRRFVVTVAASLCAAFFSVHASAQSAPSAQNTTSASGATSQADLVARAEAEGKVVVYSFTSRIARIEKAFEAKYPKIDLVAFDINSTQMIARLKAEAAAKISNADVAYISDLPVVVTDLIKPGILTPYVPASVAPKLSADLQQPLVANRLSTKVLMYSEEAYPTGSPVTNLWQLTQPAWRGKVIMVDPLVRGDYLDLMTEMSLRSMELAQAYQALNGKPLTLAGSETAGERWIKDFLANRPVFVANTDAAADAIGKLGQKTPPIGFATYSDRRDNKSRGRAIQVASGVLPSSGILFPASLGLVQGGKNPAAARLLIQFMMGDDSPRGGPGYEPFYVAGEYPARSDIAPHPDSKTLAELGAWRIDPAKTAAARKRVADMILSRQ